MFANKSYFKRWRFTSTIPSLSLPASLPPSLRPSLPMPDLSLPLYSLGPLLSPRVMLEEMRDSFETLYSATSSFRSGPGAKAFAGAG